MQMKVGLYIMQPGVIELTRFNSTFSKRGPFSKQFN